jgi:hypothetical protein
MSTLQELVKRHQYGKLVWNWERQGSSKFIKIFDSATQVEKKAKISKNQRARYSKGYATVTGSQLHAGMHC